MDPEAASNLLRLYRVNHLKMSQVEVAGLFGLSGKAYADLESAKNICREMHILAMECLIIRKNKGLLDCVGKGITEYER